MTAEGAPSPTLPASPYRGLESFDENERDYFFGREQETKTIGANLITSRLTIFYGTSGVGKTSVLRAGVMPFVRNQPDITAILFRSWSEKTFELQLKQELAAAIRERSSVEINPNLPLDECLAEASRLTRGTIVIIFDQFEEYMLYHPATSPEGSAFDNGFARSVNRQLLDANFLIAIREDAVTRLDRFRYAIPDLLGNRLRLEHLNADGARVAIRKPVERYNEVLRELGREQLQMRVETDLVEALIDQVRVGDVGLSTEGRGSIEPRALVGRVETPFLQMVLQKLWNVERNQPQRALRLQTLRNLGDARKIVRDHVDGVMQRLLPDAQETVARMFDRLVTPSGSKIAHTESDLRLFAGKTKVSTDRLLRALAHPELRLLRAVEPAQSGGDVRYEIFHDILSAPILQWCARYQRQREFNANVRRGLIAVGLVVGALAFSAIENARTANNTETDLRAQLAQQQANQTFLETNLLAFEHVLGSTMGPNTVLEIRARGLEQTGTTYRNQNGLANALKAWTDAGDLWRQLGNREAIARCDAAIDQIQQDIEWNKAYERLTHALTTDDLGDGTSGRCMLSQFAGQWLDQTGREWRLGVSRKGDVTSIDIRTFGGPLFAHGTLTRPNIKTMFTGSIEFQDGSSLKVSLPYPDPASHCQRIVGTGISLFRKAYDN